MTYALGRLVTVWMGLYYHLPRVRRWAREEGHTPTINESLDFLAEQKYRAREKTLYWKMRNVFQAMQKHRCSEVVETLEKAWSAALTSEDIALSEPVEAVSLIDFPRYYGASWPHNDIALYLPGFAKAAVMKLSDSRFEPLRKRLMTLTQGTDPFIGTAFSISHSKLHPLFNRIRCSKARPIDPKSFKGLETFKNQLESLSAGYVNASHLASHFQGKLGLELDRYVIARYGSNYALMQFVVADAEVVSAVRHKEWNYAFRFGVNGVELSGWMFRNSLFDPVAEPQKYQGSEARIAGFAIVGKSALEDYRAHLHVIAIHPLDGLAAPKATVRTGIQGPSIATIEEELLGLGEEIRKRREAYEAELELKQELILRETPKPILKIPTINEADFPPIQGRILVLLNSDRSRGFSFKEILAKLRWEGINGANYSNVLAALRELDTKELLFQNIFGDAWYINETIKVVPSGLAIPVEAVEARILEFLRKIYPTKIKIGALITKFCEEDSRIKPDMVSKAARRLLSSRMLLIDKMKRCSANPYPPKPVTELKTRPSRQPTEQLITLNEPQVLKIPDVAFAHRSRIVFIYKGNEVVKKQWVHTFQESPAIVSQIMAEIRRGTYSALEFEDHLQGRVTIWNEMGTLKGTYYNREPNNVSIILSKLGTADVRK